MTTDETNAREPSFRLAIEMGNAAMSTVADVVRELRSVADQLDLYGPTDHGTIHDLNGNAVGTFTLILPELAE